MGTKERYQRWYENNKEKAQENRKKWLEAHPDYYREYYDKNKEKERERGRKWREENPDKVKKYQEQYRRKKGVPEKRPAATLEEKNKRQKRKQRELWLECIIAYGGKCTCCGEEEIRFLNLDHIGRERPEFPDLKPRKGTNRSSSKALWKWMKNNNWPEGFQVLCWNCNQSTRWGEPCPHTKKFDQN